MDRLCGLIGADVVVGFGLPLEPALSGLSSLCLPAYYSEGVGVGWGSGGDAYRVRPILSGYPLREYEL